MNKKRWFSLFTRQARKGFALPTVLIASLVMLAILTVTLTSVQSGVAVSLDRAHYDRYAKAAAQSGLAMAKACLEANNYTATWTTNPLKPNTDCSGVVQVGLSEYIHDDSTEGVRSTFSVDPPAIIANGVQRLTVIASAQKYQSDTGVTIQTYTQSSYAAISAQATFSSVAFGYVSTGAFFGVIDPQGTVTAVGYNADGQLGNGTTSNTTTPLAFQLPSTVRAAQLYTNFLSGGFNLFTITTNGELYGAGNNTYGQLGNAASTATQSTPVKFQLPAGVTATYVAPGSSSTYVIGSDHNVYSAGRCINGILGYTYTISGCSDQNTYKRVALPAVNLSDTNTLPVSISDWVQATNLTTDRSSVFVRMQGGKVYGWGENDFGQLGTGATTDAATPVQVATLGNTSQPKATQVAFDGDSLWILDDNGDVWATGSNTYGQLGTGSPLIAGSGKCMNNPSNSTTDGTAVQIYTCNNSIEQKIEWAADGTLRFRPNSSTEKCIENPGDSTTNGTVIRIATCTGGTSQIWSRNNDGKIINVYRNKCIDNPGNSSTNNTSLQINNCNGSPTYPNQTWTLGNVLTPSKVVLPTGHGQATRITTDQWTTLLLMSDGTIWGYGLNTAGQLGNGVLSKANPKIQQFILPVGRTAVNFYTAKTGAETLLTYANSYAILDDGSVYGTGANTFGQLGNGTTSGTPISTPVMMTLPVGVKAQTIQTGIGTTVILSEEGKIYTVGNNGNGQLGDGTTTSSSLPSDRQYVNNRPVVLY